MENECCPKFDPKPWEDHEFTWEEKLFVKDHMRCIMHIPLNFGGIMTRQMKVMEAAGACPEAADFLVMTGNDTLWGADVYLAATRDVPGEKMVRLSGTYYSRVYEGPFSRISKWIADYKATLQGMDKPVKELFFYYTTCPKCAKKWGKNYVVIIGRLK